MNSVVNIRSSFFNSLDPFHEGCRVGQGSEAKMFFLPGIFCYTYQVSFIGRYFFAFAETITLLLSAFFSRDWEIFFRCQVRASQIEGISQIYRDFLYI